MSVRIGFIGSGGNARGHMNRLKSIENAQLVAFADVQEEAAKSAADEFGCRAFTDVRRMLDEAELDAVYVCIPPFAHGDAERACLERRLPMYVEKPVHLDIGVAREIAAEIDRLGIVTTSGYQERYLDIIERLKAFLVDHPVGLCMGYWMGGVARPAWWRRKAMSGGQAVEQTTHVFDMARYLLGDVRQVQAVARKGLVTEFEGYDIEDASAANLVFESGVIGTIFSGCFLNVKQEIPAGLDLYCPDAVLKYRRRKSVLVASADGTQEWVNENDYATDADRAFVNAVAAKDPSKVRCSYADAVRSLEVSLAVNRSLETGETVELPLPAGRSGEAASQYVIGRADAAAMTHSVGVGALMVCAA